MTIATLPFAWRVIMTIEDKLMIGFIIFLIIGGVFFFKAMAQQGSDKVHTTICIDGVQFTTKPGGRGYITMDWDDNGQVVYCKGRTNGQ